MDFDLKPRAVLVTVAGSRAYGLHTSTSDVDVKGVLTVPRAYIYGFRRKFEQADSPSHMECWIPYLDDDQKAAVEREKIEGTVYELRKFMGLAADCNPNILDVLFCRDSEVIFHRPIGIKLREHRDLFLSAKAKHTFCGYSFSQLKRIKRHREWLLSPPTHKPTRAEFGLAEGDTEERRKFDRVAAAVKKQMDAWSWDFGDLPKSEIRRIEDDITTKLTEMGVSASDTWHTAAASLGIPDEIIAHLEGERRYLDAKRQWGQYQTWKRQRNPERAAMEAKFGFDGKHGMHLARLLRMAREILTTGQVNVWRGDLDREELLSIREGGWSYDELVEWAEKQDREIRSLYSSKEYVVPHKPDCDKLDALCEELIEDSLSA